MQGLELGWAGCERQWPCHNYQSTVGRYSWGKGGQEEQLFKLPSTDLG